MDPAGPSNSHALRRSHRVTTLPSHLCDFHCFSALAYLQEPQSFREASSNPLWKQAMKEELDALHKTGTWDLVDLPPGKSAIGCKWIYKIKTRSDGTVDRYKARLVARGFTQKYGIDYEETFAPVARLSSVRTLIAISAARRWPLFQMDVKNAFLNGELAEEVYIPLVILSLRGFLTEYVDYGGHFMVLNKLLEHGLRNSVPLSLSMVFLVVLLIQPFF